MGNKNSGNRSKLIDYEKRERVCTKCNEVKSFAEFNWDHRRNCPRPSCIVCTRISIDKWAQQKRMESRSDAPK